MNLRGNNKVNLGDKPRFCCYTSHVTDSTSSAARGGNRTQCYRCQKFGHVARFCESKPKLYCSFCRKSSHTDSTCRSKSRVNKTGKDKVHVVHTSEEQQLEEHSLVFASNACNGDNVDKSRVRLNSLLVDCGATAHIVTNKSSHQLRRVFPSRQTLHRVSKWDEVH